MNGVNRWIYNAQIVTPTEVIKGNLRIDDHKISYIGQGDSDIIIDDKYERLDAQGMYVLPGMIDIHCDAIEKEVQPRPRTLFPMDFAMRELEKKLAVSGITTMYHSVSLGTGLSLRGEALVVELLNQIRSHAAKRAMLRHRVHLRYELTYLQGLPLAQQLLKQGMVDYLSLMNHAPGQGQYRKPGSFQAYVMINQGVTKDEVEAIADDVLRRQNEIDWRSIQSLAEDAASMGIRLASHDDDTRERINDALQLGVTVSEFPMNMDTVLYAQDHKLSICVGGPNILRGGSHDKNLSAMDAIQAGAVDIVCSDYLPTSLLNAVFIMLDQGISLPEAVNMVSLNPACAVGIDLELGSIECGKWADLLLVEHVDGYPVLRQTMVQGTTVYKSNFYEIM